MRGVISSSWGRNLSPPRYKVHEVARSAPLCSLQHPGKLVMLMHPDHMHLFTTVVPLCLLIASLCYLGNGLQPCAFVPLLLHVYVCHAQGSQ